MSNKFDLKLIKIQILTGKLEKNNFTQLKWTKNWKKIKNRVFASIKSANLISVITPAKVMHLESKWKTNEILGGYTYN